MKKVSDTLKEYAKKLNDEDLKFLSTRFNQRIGSDLSDIVEFTQKSPEIDKWLMTAESAGDFFDMLDQIEYFVQQEGKRRFGAFELKK